MPMTLKETLATFMKKLSNEDEPPSITMTNASVVIPSSELVVQEWMDGYFSKHPKSRTEIMEEKNRIAREVSLI